MDDTEPAAATNLAAVFGENISRRCRGCEPNGLVPRAKSKNWPRVASFETQAMAHPEVRRERSRNGSESMARAPTNSSLSPLPLTILC